jgi:hypothetical protein
MDSRVAADAAARWSGGLARSRGRALSATKMACPRLAPRRCAGMISRMVFGVMLLEGMDMPEDTDRNCLGGLVIFIDISGDCN